MDTVSSTHEEEPNVVQNDGLCEGAGGYDISLVKATMYLTQFKTKALSKALKQGERNTSVLTLLIKKTKNVYQELAKYINDPQVVDVLIKAGANVSKQPILLIFACTEGAEATVELLLDAGAEPTSQALHGAITQNNIDIVQLLISKNVPITDAIWTNVVDSGNLLLLSLLIPHVTNERLIDLLKSSIGNDKSHKTVLTVIQSAFQNRVDVLSELLKILYLSDSADNEVYRPIFQLSRALSDEDMLQIEEKYAADEKSMSKVVKLLHRYRK